MKKTKRGPTTRGVPEGTAGNVNYQAIWKHVYHPKRLVIQTPAIKTIQGTVVKIKPEPDGDYHVYLDKANPDEFEIICACKIDPKKEAAAMQACQGYTNKIKIPKVGDKVIVTGQYVYDTKHSQYEIHPVFNIQVKRS